MNIPVADGFIQYKSMVMEVPQTVEMNQIMVELDNSMQGGTEYSLWYYSQLLHYRYQSYIYIHFYEFIYYYYYNALGAPSISSY